MSFSSPLRVFPVQNKVQENRPDPRLDSLLTLSLQPLPHPPETAEGEGEDTTFDDNEADCEDAFSVGFIS